MATDRERGVYYRPSDYCGVGRRLLVDVTDIVVAMFLCLALSYLLLFNPKFEPGLDTFFAIFLLVWFAYFVLLKASPIGTVGYRLAGVKIVNLRGKRPHLFAFLQRFLFSVLGPFNFVLDLLWLWTDPCGQTLRDKLTHSHIVRARAEPAGWGEIVYSSYLIMGMSLVFAEVRPAPIP